MSGNKASARVADAVAAVGCPQCHAEQDESCKGTRSHGGVLTHIHYRRWHLHYRRWQAFYALRGRVAA